MHESISPSDDVSCLENITTGTHPPITVEMTIQEFYETDYDDLLEQMDMHHLHTECYRICANEVVTGEKYPVA